MIERIFHVTRSPQYYFPFQTPHLPSQSMESEPMPIRNSATSYSSKPLLALKQLKIYTAGASTFFFQQPNTGPGVHSSLPQSHETSPSAAWWGKEKKRTEKESRTSSTESHSLPVKTANNGRIDTPAREQRYLLPKTPIQHTLFAEAPGCRSYSAVCAPFLAAWWGCDGRR